MSPGQRQGEFVPTPQVESYEVPPNFASPELEQHATPERAEQRSAVELAPPPPVMPPPVIAPVTDAPAPVVPPAVDPTTSNPIAASDDDDIEKEWVDRAKQVIIQTKDNPYAREKAIGELQRDYLMKRYGRQVGASND